MRAAEFCTPRGHCLPTPAATCGVPAALNRVLRELSREVIQTSCTLLFPQRGYEHKQKLGQGKDMELI